MDGKRFNELAKAFASGQSRRSVVKGMAAGLVGGLVGLRNRGDADARTKSGPGRICREHANCSDGLYCLSDPKTRRSKCTCVDPYAFNNCAYECFSFNQSYSFNFYYDDNCTDECAYRSIDPTCSYFFNQSSL